MLRKCPSSFSHLQLFIEVLEKSLSKETCLLKEQKESFYQNSFYPNSVESCLTDSIYLALDQQEIFIKEMRQRLCSQDSNVFTAYFQIENTQQESDKLFFKKMTETLPTQST